MAVGEEFKLRYAYIRDWAAGPYLEDASFNLATSLPADPKVPILNAADPGGRSVVHELEFEQLLSPTGSTRLMWGATAKSVALWSPGQFSTSGRKHRSAYRVFGNLEYRPGAKWLFNLGASLEHDSVGGDMFDPRASTSYRLTNEQTLRLVASRAHRSPSLYEAMGRVEKKNVGTTGPFNLTYFAQGVSPELIDSVEIGYLGEFKAARASVDFRAFRERIPNRIQVVPLALPASSPDDEERYDDRTFEKLNTPFIYGRADGATNLERVLIKGYEYQLRWRPFAGTRLIYGHALVCISADLTDPSVIADTPGNTTKISTQTRESAPTHSQSAMLIQRLPGDMQASVMYFRNGPMRWRRNGVPLQASERFDWRLAKSFRTGSGRAELALTVQMANEAQEGRIGALRYADKLYWLSFRIDY